MERKYMPIIDVLEAQSSLSQKIYSENKIPFPTIILDALASGLDVIITILEQSLGPFEGLGRESAMKIHDYFKNEAVRYKSINREISIWYDSWAAIIKHFFI